jgi:RNA polymerase sigma-70 factor, ECF subfamily
METGAATPSDARLVEEIERGESAAEATFFARYSTRVYYFALSELRSQPHAEDVRSETILRVIRAIREGRLRDAQALASFVLTTARNVVREMSRQERRHQQLPDDEVEDPKYTVETVFLDPYVKTAIERVVRRLKPREREFLRMYYYDELPNDEIAQRLGIKEERLRLIKSRALKRFREIFERLQK